MEQFWFLLQGNHKTFCQVLRPKAKESKTKLTTSHPKAKIKQKWKLHLVECIIKVIVSGFKISGSIFIDWDKHTPNFITSVFPLCLDRITLIKNL